MMAANCRCSRILTQYPFPGWCQESNRHLPWAGGGSGWKKASSIQCALHVLITRGVKCIISYPMGRVQVHLHPNYVQLKIKHYWDFPGSPVVKNFFPTVDDSTHQCRGHEFDPWSGKTPHGAERPVHHNYWCQGLQLLKPMCLEPVLCDKRSNCDEKLTSSNE